jgi:hypothetical protein
VSNADVLGISGTDDTFAEAQFAFSAPLDRSWRLDAALSQIDYLDLNTFDQLGIHGGGRYRWDSGEWRNEAGLQLGYGTLDGEGFENRRTAWLQTNAVPLAGVRLRIRYRLSDIDGLNEFSSLSGQRHDASARVGWTLGEWELGTEFSIDVGDYDDARLSNTRQQLRFDAHRTLVADWSVLFEVGQRHSNYDSDSIGSEDRTELALTVSKTLSPVWRLIIRHAYTENAADQRAYDYNAMRITAGVEAML